MIARSIFFSLVLLISACGGSSGNGGSGAISDEIPDDISDAIADLIDDTLSGATSGDAIIVGQVIDAVNDTPLPDVLVTATRGRQTATTNADGRFELGLFETGDEVDLQFALDGYISEVYADPSIVNSSNELEVVQLVPDNDMGLGGASGSIRDAQGNIITNALLRFYPGINVSGRNPRVSTSPNAQGFWNVSDLLPGNYTCVITRTGQDPIFEIIQIQGGIQSTSPDIILPAIDSTADSNAIDFPDERSHTDYGSGEVTWSYSIYDYEATFGQNTVERTDEIGRIQLLHTIGPNINPLNWRDSSLIIAHTFSGPGVYPVLESQAKVIEAAESGQTAAYVTIVASGPRGTIGFARLERYVTIYDPASPGGGSVSVSVDNEGRYRFSLSALTLLKSPLNRPDLTQPDAPASILLNLSNGYVP